MTLLTFLICSEAENLPEVPARSRTSSKDVQKAGVSNKSTNNRRDRSGSNLSVGSDSGVSSTRNRTPSTDSPATSTIGTPHTAPAAPAIRLPPPVSRNVSSSGNLVQDHAPTLETMLSQLDLSAGDEDFSR